MPRVTVALFLLTVGCRFSVSSLTGTATGGDDLAAAPGDLATVDSADLATATATADLAGPPPPPADMTIDPCANPPALGNGNLAAQCVIGSPPVIDGNLADWPPSLFHPMTHATTGVVATGSWSGSAATDDPDLSARWAVRWDLDNLYVAVSVVDDVRETPNATALTQNDCVELFVDGLHNRTTTYGADDWQLVYSADQKSGSYKDGLAAALPNGTVMQKAWSGQSPNWTLEAALPWSMLGGTAPALGRVVGFDLKLDDNDSGLTTRDRDLVMFYTAASGGSCTAPYCRTDAFGAVQLLGR